MVTKGEEIKVGDKQAEEIQVEENGENNEEENKAEEEKNEKGEKTKEEADKQGDDEVDDKRNPTSLQEDETEIGDLNPADPSQAKWGYSDQEIWELESDKIFELKNI